MMRDPSVYILCNRPFGTFYIGVTSDLWDRMKAHTEGRYDGFTKRHGITRLVYYEMHETMPEAIAREKRLKKWRREWKYRIIEEMNPEWVNLYDGQNHTIAFGPAEIERLNRGTEED